MKNIVVLLILFMSALGSLQAQVTTDNRLMVTGLQPAVIVKLPGADPKFADSEWKDYVKTYGKVTKVKGSKESVIEGIHIRDIGKGGLMNVYCYVGTLADGAELVVWFNRGGSYLESSDAEYGSAVDFLNSFAKKVKVDMIANDLEDQQKKLSKLESNLTKLQKENDNLHKTITDAKAKIDGANSAIPVNVSAQETAKTNIDNQKTVLEGVKDNPEEYKVQQKLLSKEESSLTKLLKENESLHKTVTDSEAKIQQAEQDIETNLDAQKAAEKEIEDQKIVVDLVRKTLDEARSVKAE